MHCTSMHSNLKLERITGISPLTGGTSVSYEWFGIQLVMQPTSDVLDISFKSQQKNNKIALSMISE